MLGFLKPHTCALECVHNPVTYWTSAKCAQPGGQLSMKGLTVPHGFFSRYCIHGNPLLIMKAPVALETFHGPFACELLTAKDESREEHRE